MKNKLILFALSGVCLFGGITATKLAQPKPIEGVVETTKDYVVNESPTLKIGTREMTVGTGSSDVVSTSNMFAQWGKTSDYVYCLRFSVALTGAVDSITWTRSGFGDVAESVQDATCVYAAIEDNGKAAIWDGSSLVHEGDATYEANFKKYYWTCYTIKFTAKQYKEQDMSLSLAVNGTQVATGSANLWNLYNNEMTQRAKAVVANDATIKAYIDGSTDFTLNIGNPIYSNRPSEVDHMYGVISHTDTYVRFRFVGFGEITAGKEGIKFVVSKKNTADKTGWGIEATDAQVLMHTTVAPGQGNLGTHINIGGHSSYYGFMNSSHAYTSQGNGAIYFRSTYDSEAFYLDYSISYSGIGATATDQLKFVVDEVDLVNSTIYDTGIANEGWWGKYMMYEGKWVEDHASQANYPILRRAGGYTNTDLDSTDILSNPLNWAHRKDSNDKVTVYGKKGTNGIWLHVDFSTNAGYTTASTNWWQNNNVEFRFGLATDSKPYNPDGTRQFWMSSNISVNNSGTPGFDEHYVTVKSATAFSAELYVSYSTLETRLSTTFTQSSIITISLGANFYSTGWDNCEWWDSYNRTAGYEITTTNSLQRVGTAHVTSTIVDDHYSASGWADFNWVDLTPSLSGNFHATYSLNVVANQDNVTDMGGIVWRGILPIVYKTGAKANRWVNRIDWFGWVNGNLSSTGATHVASYNNQTNWIGVDSWNDSSETALAVTDRTVSKVLKNMDVLVNVRRSGSTITINYRIVALNNNKTIYGGSNEIVYSITNVDVPVTLAITCEMAKTTIYWSRYVTL